MRAAKIFAWIFVGVTLFACLLVVSIDERLPDSAAIRDGQGASATILVFITALDVYQRDTSELPTTAQGLQALRHNPGVKEWRGPYLPVKIPLDPWKRDYQASPEVLMVMRRCHPFGSISDINASGIVATTAVDTLVKESYLPVRVHYPKFMVGPNAINGRQRRFSAVIGNGTRVHRLTTATGLAPHHIASAIIGVRQYHHDDQFASALIHRFCYHDTRPKRAETV